MTPPRLASIRALYRRQRTLFDHQRIAMKILAFHDLTDHAERGLTAYLTHIPWDIRRVSRVFKLEK